MPMLLVPLLYVNYWHADAERTRDGGFWIIKLLLFTQVPCTAFICHKSCAKWKKRTPNNFIKSVKTEVVTGGSQKTTNIFHNIFGLNSCHSLASVAFRMNFSSESFDWTFWVDCETAIFGFIALDIEYLELDLCKWAVCHQLLSPPSPPPKTKRRKKTKFSNFDWTALDFPSNGGEATFFLFIARAIHSENVNLSSISISLLFGAGSHIMPHHFRSPFTLAPKLYMRWTVLYYIYHNWFHLMPPNGGARGRSDISIRVRQKNRKQRENRLSE